MNEIGATMDRATTELAEALGALAEGDLTKSVKTEYGGRLGQLKDAFNETVAGLAETVQALQITAVDVGTAARRSTAAPTTCPAGPRNRHPRWNRRQRRPKSSQRP